MYRRIRLLFLAGIFINIFGCATYTSNVEKEYKPQPKMAYLFGRFSKTGLPNFGLAVENKAKTNVYTFRFNSDKRLSIIEVMPDEYEITHFTAANAFGEKMGNRPLSGWPYNTVFSVEAGKIYYVGDYSATYSFEAGFFNSKLSWKIDGFVDNFESASRELDKDYSAFTRLHKLKAFIQNTHTNM